MEKMASRQGNEDFHRSRVLLSQQQPRNDTSNPAVHSPSPSPITPWSRCWQVSITCCTLHSAHKLFVNKNCWRKASTKQGIRKCHIVNSKINQRGRRKKNPHGVLLRETSSTVNVLACLGMKKESWLVVTCPSALNA